MGNFSGNTFDALKRYVGVRLQQGVPILDADWNEMEDIHRYELEAFVKWFVGDGVPKGSNGFAIGSLNLDIGHRADALADMIAAGADAAHIEREANNSGLQLNDFAITEGWCLVQGWQVENPAPLNFGQTKNRKIPTPDKNRTDLVYLDVWEYEINDVDNPVYKVIDIQPSVRIKREWAVHVEMDLRDTNISNWTHPTTHDDRLPIDGNTHHYYPLALLNRRKDWPLILEHDITDLRRTGVATLSQELTIKDGKVGVGTTDPQAKLHIGTGDNALRIEGPENAGGTALNLGGHGDFSIDKPNTPGGRFIVRDSGNVGIGIADPQASLDVGNGEIRWGGRSRLNNEQGGSIDLGGDNSSRGTGTPFIDFYHSGGTDSDYNARIINDEDGRLSIFANTLRVTNGDIQWGNGSRLSIAQGGSIELGGDNSTPGTGTPLIDFHFVGMTQDYNTRIINDANGRLSIVADTLRVTGDLGIGTDSPRATLDVGSGEIAWGGQSRLNNEQGGSIDLGGDNSSRGTGTPFIDFYHSGGPNTDYNARIINDEDGRLSIFADTLFVSGNVGIGTTDPRAALHIKRAAPIPLIIEGSSGSNVTENDAIAWAKSLPKINSAVFLGYIVSNATGPNNNALSYLYFVWRDQHGNGFLNKLDSQKNWTD